MEVDREEILHDGVADYGAVMLSNEIMELALAALVRDSSGKKECLHRLLRVIVFLETLEKIPEWKGPDVEAELARVRSVALGFLPENRRSYARRLQSALGLPLPEDQTENQNSRTPTAPPEVLAA